MCLPKERFDFPSAFGYGSRIMKKFRCGLFLWLVGCVWLLAASNGQAATNSWTWGAGGFWTSGTNWSLLGAPGTNSEAVQINAAGLSKTVIVDPSSSPTNLTINRLIVASSGTKSNWLAISNLTAANPFRILGGASVEGPNSNQGRIIVTNSTVIFDGTNGLGGLTVSNGLVLVQSGASLLFTNGAMPTIGSGAVGSLTVLSNGVLKVALSNLVVGNALNGIGNMTVGGTVDVGFTFTIGDDVSSTGTVVVAGGLLRAVNTNANAEIGQHGGGQLTLSNGVCQFDDISVGRHAGAHGTFRIFNGACSGSDLSIGRFDDAYGVFSMAGGQLTLSGDLYAGRGGTGTVSVTGGTITAKDFLVAVTNGTFGTATFSGGTSVFSGAIIVGSVGSTGTVVIAGGSFSCTNPANSAVTDVVRGSITVSNGLAAFDSILLTNTGQLRFFGGTTMVDQVTVSNSSGAPFVIGNGTNVLTVRLTGGGSTFYNGLVVSSNVTLIGSGAINGAVTNCGTIIADGAPLVFTGTVTNCGTITTTNGGTIRYGAAGSNVITDVRQIGPLIRLSFTTTNGVYYTPVFKNNFSDPLWLPLSTVPGNNSVRMVDDADTGHPQRFYRVRVQ